LGAEAMPAEVLTSETEESATAEVEAPMSDQGKPQASLNVIDKQIVVQCTEQVTRVPLDSTKRLRDQYSMAVFAHERACEHCDLSYAYERGSPEFDWNLAHDTQDQIGEREK
jgi:hypothetical protein